MAPAPILVPSQWPLAPNVTSVTNDKGDNVMIPGAVHRSPGICLTAEENPRKPQLGDHLMKGLCDQSFPQIGSFSSKWGRLDRTARQGGRWKERTGRGYRNLPSVDDCGKDHSWRCHTQMTAKCREYFSKLDYDHLLELIYLYFPPSSHLLYYNRWDDGGKLR